MYTHLCSAYVVTSEGGVHGRSQKFGLQGYDIGQHRRLQKLQTGYIQCNITIVCSRDDLSN